MGLMTYTRDQWLATFDADKPTKGQMKAARAEMEPQYSWLVRGAMQAKMTK